MAVNVVSFLFSWCSTRGPGPQLSAEWWLSLLYLISNWSPKLHRGSRGSLRPGVAFPTTSCLQRLWSPTQSGAPRAPFGLAWLSLPHLHSNSNFLSWLSYIIVQRPLNPWNGMFDRHQAEITVMQFRGHSLLVHQSMSIAWDFLPCSILSANFCLRDFFRLLAIGMCHFLPVHHFGMVYLARSKVKIHQYADFKHSCTDTNDAEDSAHPNLAAVLGNTKKFH